MMRGIQHEHAGKMELLASEVVPSATLLCDSETTAEETAVLATLKNASVTNSPVAADVSK